MVPIKPALSILSPASRRARLSILLFHRVRPQPDTLYPGEVDARQFNEMMGWVRNWCNVLPLDVAVDRLKDGTLPARAAAITFDDGYADNHDVALPILQRHGLTAAFFVATAFLNGGRMWNDTVIESVRHCTDVELDLRELEHLQGRATARWSLDSPAMRSAAIAGVIARIKYEAAPLRQTLADATARIAGVMLPTNMMMTSEQVMGLKRAGMQIGAHTHTHPILARLDSDAAREEILRSKTELQTLIGEPVTLFAYPNGRPELDYNAASVQIVRSLGFAAAVSTATGAAGSNTDMFQLPRFTPWDRTRTRFGVRLAANLLREPQIVR
jgi:peptidoglycan/xylan/chitin deacetylase (PgdA/CDA1 family)